ncbi:hypothetical protein MASR1M32_10200 [Rhodobacter sp.]
MTRRPDDPPAIAPKDGLRQRRRADGSWRLWWEPSARLRTAGAKPVEFAARNPGHAQREATRLMEDWTARADGRAAGSRRDGRSTASLIADYKASRHFLRLRPSTQASYDYDMRAIDAKWGPQPVALFDPPMMDAWYDTLCSTKGPGRGRAIMQMMSTLMRHAERRGWRPRGSNPARDLQTERYARRVRRGNWEELDALLAAARKMERQDRGSDLRITSARDAAGDPADRPGRPAPDRCARGAAGAFRQRRAAAAGDARAAAALGLVADPIEAAE